MANAPDGLVLRRHRDLAGRTWHPWVRRSLLGLVAVVALLALIGLFGQRPSTTRVGASAATLAVSMPGTVRGGLLFQARFTIRTRSALKDATLVLGQNWLDGLTVNTIEPSPLNQASRDGSLALELGHLPAGATHVLFVEYQVNPNTVGRRMLRVELDDGEQPLLTLSRRLTILP